MSGNGARFSVIGVPIDSVGMSGPLQGTELSPKALREAGIVAALGAEDLGDVDVRIGEGSRDPKWGVVSFPDVLSTSLALRRRFKEIFAAGKKPFILGGCCTQIIGIMAGARDAFGTVGIAYLDGHNELYDGQTSFGGEAADLPLGTLLGHGPAPLLKAIGPGNVLRPQDVALAGYRDLEESEARGSLGPADIGPDFFHLDSEAVRRDPKGAGERARASLEANSGRFLLYVDWDILDEEIFPATDVLMPNGLGWAELEALAAPLAASPACIGMALGCYNPTRDPGYKNGREAIAFFKRIAT